MPPAHHIVIDPNTHILPYDHLLTIPITHHPLPLSLATPLPHRVIAIPQITLPPRALQTLHPDTLRAAARSDSRGAARPCPARVEVASVIVRDEVEHESPGSGDGGTDQAVRQLGLRVADVGRCRDNGVAGEDGGGWEGAEPEGGQNYEAVGLR